jgi:hypothetical protein
VKPLWQRIDRAGARRRVSAAVRGELARVAGVVDMDADRVLRDRLARRLVEQGGPGAVVDPVGWLLRRGLPARPGCGDARCDDGLRMDTGCACDTCASRLATSRSLRHRIAEQVDADLPRATEQERRAAYEQQLREAVTRQLADAQQHRARAAADRERRLADAAEARVAAEMAKRARQVQPCVDCGRPDSAGRCGTCENRRTVEGLIVEAALMAAAAEANDNAAIAAAHAEAGVRRELDQELTHAKAQNARPETLALLARLTVANAAERHRRAALTRLARSETALAEARLAYETKMRDWRRTTFASQASARAAFASHAAALATAASVAEQARQRTAEHLLTTRTAALREATRTTTPLPADATAKPSGAARVRAALHAHKLRADTGGSPRQARHVEPCGHGDSGSKNTMSSKHLTADDVRHNGPHG